ncbi:hypothetical protein AMAG_09563 [Allomyces macrogynus ATCC 38327]|uniref:Uncharacterized protein n=1 Tax=Allomyces macrogynus (strain ATCC 38327) TaxID=578462 RepID=A0A0L0SSP6_ALLM3|nr:hypothetical protein AMAG_09563 [Allomyces macrogynus ATCC 38327]|eukprot:KNE65583.1 hypothetical protein AMAG_09563 [Allomyces macrogynus ATCC 38327]
MLALAQAQMSTATLLLLPATAPMDLQLMHKHLVLNCKWLEYQNKLLQLQEKQLKFECMKFMHAHVQEE